MAGPVLIVELPDGGTTSAEVAALVRSCSEALGSGRCETASSTTTAADGVAVVSLRSRDGLRALIEVGSRGPESRPWRSQELSFQPQDARIERFRTLGLAIATLYNEAQLEDAKAERPDGDRANGTRAPRAEKAAPAAGKPGGPSPRPVNGAESVLGAGAPPHSNSTPPPSAWLSAGVVTAYDHELPSPLRFGGQLALGLAPPVDLPLFASLSGSYAVGRFSQDVLPSPISLSFATIATGGGGYVTLIEDTQLRVSVQGVLVKLEAHGSDPTQGQQESQRWLLGGQAGVELVGWASRRWGLAFGSTVQQLTGGTAIAVHGQPVAKVAAFSFQVGASVELRPFQR